MKTTLTILMAFNVAVAISCSREADFPPKPTSSIVFSDESDTELLFDENGASKTVKFTSAKAWTAAVQDEEGQEWCTLSPDEGPGGDMTLTVRVAENETPDERNTSILVKSGVTKKTIVVNQKPSGSILLSSAIIEVGAEGGTFLLTAKANEECTVTVPADCQNWITALATRSVTTIINLTVAPNDALTERKGQLTLSNGTTTETVTVNQAAAAADISLSIEKFDCPEDETEFTVDVTSNVPYTVTVSDSWVTPDPANTATGPSFKYKVQANETIVDRTASITFANDEYKVTKVLTVNQSGKKGDGSIRILAIGNSFSDDALEYLYQILEQAGYTSIKLGNLYIGGCTLATHASNFTSEAKAYDYRVNTDGTWVTTPSYSSVDAIKSDNWDYISLQQASGSSGMPDTYEPSLTTLIDGVKALKPKAKLMWHMTWAYQQTSTHSEFPNYNSDQMTMYNAIVSTVQSKVLMKDDIKVLIPSGTAIQNLRTSVIGDNLTRDGYHLSTNIGRFAAALMWAKQISGCDLETISWIPSGNVYTQKQLQAIKEAVNNAYEHPLEVTASTITTDDEDINASLETVMRAGGYNPDNYQQLSFDLIHPGYYNSNSNIPMTVQTNMKNYATTRVFEKAEFPDGTLIVQRAGYGYRPEGWVAADQKNDKRPDNTNVQIVEVNEAWWGDFTLRAFNIFKTGVSDLTSILDEVKNSFGIFVPKPSGNPELDKILTSNGYNPSDYTMLSFDLIHPGYYNSSSDIPMTVQTNMKNFATTRIFTKSDIPEGSLIVQKEGYLYRPEGWIEQDGKMSSRPNNVNTQFVIADATWWGDYNFRAFNIQKSGVSDLTDILDEVKESFGIYVPKYATNAALEQIVADKGYNTSKYRMLRIEITTYRYYNSTDKNMISTPGTNMKNYAATEILPKERIPNGSLIVQKDGFQYRPEGWTALDEVTVGRPANVTDMLVEVDDAWWREFNYRGFNLAEKGNPTLDDARQEALKSAFGIFVPVK